MAKVAPYTFGCEIECFGVPTAVTAYVLRKAGFKVLDTFDRELRDDEQHRNAAHGRYDDQHWVIAGDGSIEGLHPQEIKSPILKGAKGITALRKFIRTLAKLGLQVNSSTGLHVHVGVTKTDPGFEVSPKCVFEILKRYASNQKTIEAMVHESRREGQNTYVREVRSLVERIENSFNPEATCEAPPRNWARMADYQRAAWIHDGSGDFYWRRDGRYHADPEPVNVECLFDTHENLARQGDHYDALNISALSRFGTLEFRQHQGSMNAAEVVNWVLFVLNHVETTRKLHKGEIGKGRGRKPGLFAGLPVNVREHFKKQARKFGPKYTVGVPLQASATSAESGW
jgi:hypothetical protein